jgi:hypothetical protein
MGEAYVIAALDASKDAKNRRYLGDATMSNNLALSDMQR